VSRRRAIIAENRRKEYQNRYAADLKSEANALSNKPKLHYIRTKISDVKTEEPITFDFNDSNKKLPTIQAAILKVDVRY
jgi:hypothetical protein